MTTDGMRGAETIEGKTGDVTIVRKTDIVIMNIEDDMTPTLLPPADQKRMREMTTEEEMHVDLLNEKVAITHPPGNIDHDTSHRPIT